MNHHKIHVGIFTCVVMTASALADEKLPVLKVGEDTYTNVTVTRVTSTDIYFTFDKGVANAKLKKLDPELRERFHDAALQSEARKQEEKAAAAPRAAVAPLPPVVMAANEAAHIVTAQASEAIQAEMNEAIAKVKTIVNQTVPPIFGKPNKIHIYRSGWFTEHKVKPNFTVDDVRRGQDLSFAKNYLVGSPSMPNFYFKGADLEYNLLTEYFYDDMSVPKKKLTEEEMIEINRLYRIIGRNEDLLAGKINTFLAPINDPLPESERIRSFGQ